MSHAKTGDLVRLGVCLGYAIEPYSRWGRLVGIRRDDCREIHRYVVREYAPGDGAFPTGAYVTTSLLYLVAHEQRDGCRDSDLMRRRVQV